MKHKKAQAAVYWKIITYIIAIALLLWMIVYYTGLRGIITDLLSQFFNIFK